MSLIPLARLASRITASNLGELSLPYRLTFSVTNRCQARCTMCNIWQKPLEDELTLAEIDLIFSKATRFSWINLTGGELFQRPDISDMFLTIISRSRDLHILNFPTNGIQTDEIVATVDDILTRTSLPRLIISVSMDGPPELHDRIRGVANCWVNAVATFCKLRERHSDRFSVYFGHTVQAANLGAFAETFAACRSACSEISIDDFHINLAHKSSHYYDNADLLSLPDPEKAVQSIEQIDTQRSLKLLDPVAFVENRYRRLTRQYLKHGRSPLPCQAAAASCFINPEGVVFPCTGFPASIGSLRDNDMDLYRIWHSAKRSQVRQQVCDDNCPGCWTPCEAYQTILANLIPGTARP